MPTILKDQFNKPRTENPPAFIDSGLSLFTPKNSTDSEKSRVY